MNCFIHTISEFLVRVSYLEERSMRSWLQLTNVQEDFMIAGSRLTLKYKVPRGCHLLDYAPGLTSDFPESWQRASGLALIVDQREERWAYTIVLFNANKNELCRFPALEEDNIRLCHVHFELAGKRWYWHGAVLDKDLVCTFLLTENHQGWERLRQATEKTFGVRSRLGTWNIHETKNRLKVDLSPLLEMPPLN